MPVVYRVLGPSGAYIGQTSKTAEERFRGHLEQARTGSLDCPKLYNAIRKYGESRFQVEALQHCESQEHANKAEVRWISCFDTRACGYNVTAGGLGHAKTFCTAGHCLSVSGRARNGECAVCRPVRRRAYYQKNRESINAKSRAYQKTYERTPKNLGRFPAKPRRSTAATNAYKYEWARKRKVALVQPRMLFNFIS